MKKTILAVISLLLLAVTIAGCDESDDTLLTSDISRNTDAEVSISEAKQLAFNNSEFAFDLYHFLSDEDGNLFYSPYSISQALAMTYAGARGVTEQEMADVLHFNLPQNELHPAFNGLDLLLNSRGEGAKGKDGGDFKLNIVNAIWGQKDYTFLPEFLNVLAEDYGAGLRVLDFAGQTEESRITINDWVSDQTNDRIKDLLAPGVIDSMTRLVLTNAVYFNAAWEYEFDKDNTRDRDFFLLDGSREAVEMMRQTETFGYIDNEDCRVIELPYDGKELSMVIIMPDSGTFSTFEDTLSADAVQDIIDGLVKQEVNLTMPKFEFTSEFSLNQALEDMGMPSAFYNADFSGMTGSPDLFISAVVHKAFVLVEEEGTEAAAATAVTMNESASANEPVSFIIDHPFIFLIRDIETGTILFAGRYVQPE